MENISKILIFYGCMILSISFLGFCAIPGRRRFFMHLLSVCLLMLAVCELVFGILVAIRHSRADEYMSQAWDQLSDSGRGVFESAFGCCGYRKPTDRTACPAAKIATSQACYVQLSSKQELLLEYLCVGLFISAATALMNYFVSYLLATQYTKEQVRNDVLQLDREPSLPARSKAPETVASPTPSKASHGYRYKNNPPAPETCEVQQTASTEKPAAEGKSNGLSFLPKFLRPVPKPTVNLSERNATVSTGSQLTYDEIVAKYRNKN